MITKGAATEELTSSSYAQGRDSTCFAMPQKASVCSAATCPLLTREPGLQMPTPATPLPATFKSSTFLFDAEEITPGPQGMGVSLAVLCARATFMLYCI